MDSSVKVIDLFCWVWGLTHWLVRQGFDVVAGIDFDESTDQSSYEWTLKK